MATDLAVRDSAMPEDLAEAPAPPRPAGRRPARRPEVDGLRALAVGLVVVYHVFTGRVSGGVDVFLALTGFFLVHSLAGRLRSGTFDPITPIARSLSRLAPAAFVVLGATVALSAVVVPETRWREIVEHLIASVTFTENLHLVDEAVEYAANDAAASPMQQFWSLSIQVQVLVAVPLIVAAVLAGLRAAGAQRYGRPLAVALVAAATAASFAWSLAATSADQQAAYFATLPRLWELGVGALAALLLVGRPGRRLGLVLGWSGVLALVVCGAVLDGVRTFPGWQAAWPVLCAVAVLVAADTGGRFGVHRVLTVRPMQWLGRRAYVVYLWHWPLLVLHLVHTGRQNPSPVGAVGVIAVSLVLAALTHRMVERPGGNLLRSRRPAWVLVLVVACAAPLLAGGLAVTTYLDRQLAAHGPALDDPRYPGARALTAADVVTGGVADVEAVPPLSVLRDDWASLEGASCRVETVRREPLDAKIAVCIQGPDDATRRVVVVGDSHMNHWLPPMSTIAAERGWQLISLPNPGCNLSTGSEFYRPTSARYGECAAWRATVADRIVAFDPDVVLAMGTRIDPGEREVLPPGFVEAWEQLAEAGVPVIGMRDNPRNDRDVPDCVAELGDRAAECSVSPDEVYDDRVLRAALPEGVQLLDTRPYFCTEESCPAVVGNVRVYMDDAHVTAMYMRTVAPLLERDLLRLTGW
ncbi:acyltransferase family protein [Blastococcus sp. SYSU DS1024]